MTSSRTPERFEVPSRLGRFAAYGLAGWCAEILFTGIHDFARHRDNRLPSRSSLWMFPVYGLMQPLYEPLHDAVRDRLPAPARAALYGGGFLAVEYAAGRLLRGLLGRAPWDYSYARRHVDGLIRPDYLFVWAAAGLAAEPLHDLLAGRARPRRAIGAADEGPPSP
jgi:Putative ABC-transporter type IV